VLQQRDKSWFGRRRWGAPRRRGDTVSVGTDAVHTFSVRYVYGRFPIPRARARLPGRRAGAGGRRGQWPDDRDPGSASGRQVALGRTVCRAERTSVRPGRRFQGRALEVQMAQGFDGLRSLEATAPRPISTRGDATGELVRASVEPQVRGGGGASGDLRVRRVFPGRSARARDSTVTS